MFDQFGQQLFTEPSALGRFPPELDDVDPAEHLVDQGGPNMRLLPHLGNFGTDIPGDE